MVAWLTEHGAVLLVNLIASGTVVGLLRVKAERKKLGSETGLNDANAVQIITDAAAKIAEDSRADVAAARADAREARAQAASANRRAEAAERRAQRAEESAFQSARAAAECAQEVQRIRDLAIAQGVILP